MGSHLVKCVRVPRIEERGQLFLQSLSDFWPDRVHQEVVAGNRSGSLAVGDEQDSVRAHNPTDQEQLAPAASTRRSSSPHHPGLLCQGHVCQTAASKLEFLLHSWNSVPLWPQRLSWVLTLYLVSRTRQSHCAHLGPLPSPEATTMHSFWERVVSCHRKAHFAVSDHHQAPGHCKLN